MFREPLFQFLVAGAVLFAGYAYLHPGSMSQPGSQAVRIGQGEIRWLEETFASQQGRAPTKQELSGLVETLVEEELLAREARAMGLDQGDTVVRRRLAQKLTFMMEDTAHIAEPTEADLRRYYELNVDRFRSAPLVSFVQVFFNPGRGPQVEIDARAALTRISAAGDDAAIQGMGDSLLLEDTYRDLDQQALSNLFGADFATAVFALTPGSWSGPIKSGYGLHLVKVTTLKPGKSRSFGEVRDKVADAWRSEQERSYKASYLADLRRKYGVEIDQQLSALVDLAPAGVAK